VAANVLIFDKKTFQNELLRWNALNLDTQLPSEKSFSLFVGLLYYVLGGDATPVVCCVSISTLFTHKRVRAISRDVGPCGLYHV